MKLSVRSSTSIHVTWGRPDCRDRNGEITSYLVRYGEEGTSEGDRTVKMVSGVVFATIISGLTKETVYTIAVAARTSAGTGVYSHPQIIKTPDSEYESLCSSNVIISSHYTQMFTSA